MGMSRGKRRKVSLTKYSLKLITVGIAKTYVMSLVAALSYGTSCSDTFSLKVSEFQE